MKYLIYVALSTLLSAGNVNAMIIRHDVNEQKYLDLGEKYSPSVAYIGGCAGTLIDSNWILTAAHCVKGREHTLFSVRHIDREYRVEKIVVHPEHNIETSEQFDIALIQLMEPIKKGKPAHLYQLNDEKGKSVVFVGRGTFGNGRDGLIQDDGKQRGATNTVISTSEHVIGFEFNAPENATLTEGISGPGDSGGPAFVTLDSQLYVAGVSSYQEGNGFEEGTYGVLEYYTRVSTNYLWINSVLEKTEPASVASHPVIDSIIIDSKQQLEQAVSRDVLEDNVIMSEAFYQTVALNRVELAELLFSHGADIDLITINGASLFELALLYDRQEYFNMLVARFSLEENIHKEQSVVLPLLVSTLGDDAQVTNLVKRLLDQGANIDAQTDEGETAIILAGWLTNNMDLIRSLVEQGADVNLPNNNGDTPLIDAAYLGKNEILEYLLLSGADVEVKNKNGKSALDMARSKKNQKAIKLLVAYSKDK